MAGQGPWVDFYMTGELSVRFISIDFDRRGIENPHSAKLGLVWRASIQI